jgi:hypothetical protein
VDTSPGADRTVMGALRTSSYQVTQPGLVSTRQYPVYRSTGQLKDIEVCQLAGQIGTGHCMNSFTVNLSGYLR